MASGSLSGLCESVDSPTKMWSSAMARFNHHDHVHLLRAVLTVRLMRGGTLTAARYKCSLCGTSLSLGLILLQPQNPVTFTGSQRRNGKSQQDTCRIRGVSHQHGHLGGGHVFYKRTLSSFLIFDRVSVCRCSPRLEYEATCGCEEKCRLTALS